MGTVPTMFHLIKEAFVLALGPEGFEERIYIEIPQGKTKDRFYICLCNLNTTKMDGEK